MPEGPEVKLCGERLASNISGQTLKYIEIISGRYSKKTPGGIELFGKELPTTVVGPGVHGKFIYWIMKNNYFLYNTLGLTGAWSLEQGPYSRVKFSFENLDIFFDDKRNFGTLKFVKGKGNLLSKLQSLGPDMLSGDVEISLFIDRLREKSSWEITKALMNQSVVAGIGNYIKSESLWKTKINPHSRVCDLDNDTLADLCVNIRDIMSDSYKSQKEGDNSFKLSVYSRKNDPHDNEIIKEKTEDGRTTYWCPSVQHKGTINE